MSDPTDSQLPPIVAFYLGRGRDSKGRTIEEIWSWENAKLEYIHDYIQWLFPLRERSRFNPDAPTLNGDVIQEFHTSADLKGRLVRSLEVMLRFYGLRCANDSSGKIRIEKSDEYAERMLNWTTFGNHNYLRLTRVLISLKTFGLEAYALALFECLSEIYQEESERIGSVTYSYWKNAVWK